MIWGCVDLNQLLMKPNALRKRMSRPRCQFTNACFDWALTRNEFSDLTLSERMKCQLTGLGYSEDKLEKTVLASLRRLVRRMQSLDFYQVRLI